MNLHGSEAHKIYVKKNGITYYYTSRIDQRTFLYYQKFIACINEDHDLILYQPLEKMSIDEISILENFNDKTYDDISKDIGKCVFIGSSSIINDYFEEIYNKNFEKIKS